MRLDSEAVKYYLLCSVFFLAQTLHTFYNSIPSMCRFSNFYLLKSKFIIPIVSFFKQKVSCSSKLLSLCSVMRDHSSVVSHLNFKYYWKKKYIKVDIFRLATAGIKINQISHGMLWSKGQLFLQTLYHPSVSWDITPL